MENLSTDSSQAKPEQEQVSSTQTSQRPNNPKKPNNSLKAIGLVLFVIVVAGAAAFGGYTKSDNKAKKSDALLQSQITALKSTDYKLPAGAFKVSDCIPGMGSHYALKTGDKEYGPFVLVNKQGNVIGSEYMAGTEMFTAIPNTKPPVSLIAKNSPMFGWKYDHTVISHLPQGHEGYLKDHIDVHLFTVSEDQVSKSCV